MTPKDHLEPALDPKSTMSARAHKLPANDRATRPSTAAGARVGSGDVGAASSSLAPTAAAGLAPVRRVVEPVLAAHHVELVELAWVTERAGRTLRVTIERSGVGPTPEEQLLVGFGVSLEDCAEVSRDLSAAFDEADVIPHAYILEVSSPGLDRPLRHVADFRRFVGQLAKVKLRKPAPDGQRVLRGHLRQVTGEGDAAAVAVEVDRKTIVVPYADVDAANLVYELPTQPKRAPSRTPQKGQVAKKGQAPPKGQEPRKGQAMKGRTPR